DAGAVHRAGVAQLLDRAARGARQPALPGLSRRGLRPVAGLPVDDQYRREHGRAAHQGPYPAADELSALPHARDARLGGTADARRPARHERLARHGHDGSIRGPVRRSARRPRDRSRRMSAAGTRAPILVMAGGTGGHVFPALALARLLRAESREVIWLGT